MAACSCGLYPDHRLTPTVRWSDDAAFSTGEDLSIYTKTNPPAVLSMAIPGNPLAGAKAAADKAVAEKKAGLVGLWEGGWGG